MQFSLRPDGWLERVALWLNLGPAPMAQAFYGMMAARAAMAGVRLGVFRALAQGPRSAEELARGLQVDPSGLQALLRSLAALGLVRTRRGAWETAPRMRRWLDPASDRYVGDFLEFNYTQWGWWSGLEDAVRSGRGVEIHGFAPDDPRWRDYVLAMFELARLSAPEVARKIRLPPRPRSLLDLGGGHGWFAAELCRRHPTLAAKVLDLPPSARIGRELIARAGMSARVQHVEADLRTAPLGEGHDAILCFQILHHLSPQDAESLVRRAANALRPGGTLAILEPLEEAAPNDASALLALHFFLTSQASAYRMADVERWLSAAGLALGRVARIRRIPLMTLVTATKRG